MVESQYVPFGTLEGHEIKIMDFCPDPDGSGLPWFRFTGDSVSVSSLKLLTQARSQYRGNCFDVGEWESHAGKLLKAILSNEVPANSSIASFSIDSSAGTRTFFEEVTVQFYEGY